MSGRKIQLPMKISRERLDRTDRAREVMAKKAGVPVSRTAFIDRAIDQLCSQVEDDDYRDAIAEKKKIGPSSLSKVLYPQVCGRAWRPDED